jgi:hypothetical protein
MILLSRRFGSLDLLLSVILIFNWLAVWIGAEGCVGVASWVATLARGHYKVRLTCIDLARPNPS